MAVAVPLMGGGVAVVGAPDEPVGSVVLAGGSPATAVAGSSLLTKLRVTKPSGLPARASSASSVSSAKHTSGSASAATESKKTKGQGSARSKNDNSTQSTSHSQSNRVAPGVTARLAASSTHSVVHKIVKVSPPSAPGGSSDPKSCPSAVDGTPSTVPGTITSQEGVAGTTDADLSSFALEYDAQRVADCLPPIPLQNIRYDPCLQARMFWIAEDPSTNLMSAWGHDVPRSDGKKIVGCDGDIAAGLGDTGAIAADKWWNSPDHRSSLYQPKWGDASYANVCIGFAISHGGIPNDPITFSRESARWEDCSTFGS